MRPAKLFIAVVGVLAMAAPALAQGVPAMGAPPAGGPAVRTSTSAGVAASPVTTPRAGGAMPGLAPPSATVHERYTSSGRPTYNLPPESPAVGPFGGGAFAHRPGP